MKSTYCTVVLSTWDRASIYKNIEGGGGLAYFYKSMKALVFSMKRQIKVFQNKGGGRRNICPPPTDGPAKEQNT